MKKLLSIILVVAFVIGLAGVVSAAPNWRVWGGDPQYTHYFDTQSLKTTSPQTFTVWTKLVYEKDSGQEISKKLGYKYPVGNIISKMEINHTNSTCRILSSTYYDENGTLLSSNEAAGNWTNVAGHNISEYMYNKLCEFYKRHYT